MRWSHHLTPPWRLSCCAMRASINSSSSSPAAAFCAAVASSLSSTAEPFPALSWSLLEVVRGAENGGVSDDERHQAEDAQTEDGQGGRVRQSWSTRTETRRTSHTQRKGKLWFLSCVTLRQCIQSFCNCCTCTLQSLLLFLSGHFFYKFLFINSRKLATHKSSLGSSVPTRNCESAVLIKLFYSWQKAAFMFSLKTYVHFTLL